MLKRVSIIIVLALISFFLLCAFATHSHATSIILCNYQNESKTQYSDSNITSENDINKVLPSESQGIIGNENESDGINWTTVFEIILGTVLGFISTVTVGLLTKFASSHRLLKKMRQELEEIHSIIKKNINTDDRFLSISPIWDYIIHSDILFTFSAKKYASIVRIYGEIQSFKKSEESAAISKTDLVNNRTKFINILENNNL